MRILAPPYYENNYKNENYFEIYQKIVNKSFECLEFTHILNK